MSTGSISTNPASSLCVKGKTAPRPIFGMLHQSAVHRICVHVVQLLFLLLVAVYVEIVKPRCQNCGRSAMNVGNTSGSCAFGVGYLPLFLILRETRCLSICNTVEGVPFFGSLINTCT